MASRYWIGGTGNWGDTSHWSDVSGGISGATVPTSVDDVIFDNGSGTGTVTVNVEANMLDLIFSGISAMTLSNAVNAFNVYGSLTLHTNLTVTFTGTGYLYMKATDSRFINTNNISANYNVIYFNGTGSWDIQNNFTYLGNSVLYFNSGTINTNGYIFNIAQFNEAAGGTKYLNLSSSSLNIGIIGLSNTILDAGTSTINMWKWGFNVSNKTLYNVNIDVNGSDNIGSNNIFNNLTITCSSSVGDGIYFNGNQTINGTLSIQGNNSSTQRILMGSNIVGTPRTITCNGTITASNVDFRDIIISGTTAQFDASAIPGGSGDCGGNSNIIFTPSQTQYYKHIGGGTTLWSDATKWFSDSELTIIGRVPLPQDDAIFLANSFSQACTLNVDVPRIGRSLDMSAVNQTVTMSLANNIECYGSYVLGGLIVTSGSYAINLHGRQIHDLNLYEKLVYNIELWGIGGTYVNQSNINCSGMRSYVVCTFDFNDFNATLRSLMNLAYVGSTVILGNGILKSTRSSNLGSLFTFINSFVQAEGSTIILEPVASASEVVLFQGGGNTFNKVIISGEYQGVVNIEGNTSFNELVIEKGKKVSFTSGTTKTIGKLTAVGTPQSPITITSTTTTPFNITKSLPLYEGVNCDYLNVSYSTATPEKTFFAGYNSTLSNTTGWIQDYQYRDVIIQPDKKILTEEGTGRIVW